MENAEWGKTVEDLAVGISMARTKYRAGEPIVLDIALKNVGRTPTLVVMRPAWAGYEFKVLRDGVDVPSTPRGESLASSAQMGPRANATLAPGEIRRETVELDQGFDMTAPGTYAVVVTFATYKKGTMDQYATVPSNEARIEVTR